MTAADRLPTLAPCDESLRFFRFGGKWHGHIYTALRSGSRRFTEILAAIDAITPKVLTDSLRELERDGFIGRAAHATEAQHVRYHLTPLGQSVEGPLKAVCAWHSAHEHQVVAARIRREIE